MNNRDKRQCSFIECGQKILILHDIFPISFDSGRSRDWTGTTFGALRNNNVIGFPTLTLEEVNPTAIELCGGPHCLMRANSVLTYMSQILTQGQNLTREETIQAVSQFPWDWKVEYLQVETPSDFVPTPGNQSWSPEYWNTALFGEWRDLTFVRCHIPPSYKTATRANYHWVVIGFSNEPSNRLSVRSPLDRIQMFRCFSCPAKNGSLSFDRHLATLLIGLSFPNFYRSTARTVNLLNTVAEPARQCTFSVPARPHSVDIPANIVRRSATERRRSSANPLYDDGNNIYSFLKIQSYFYIFRNKYTFSQKTTTIFRWTSTPSSASSGSSSNVSLSSCSSPSSNTNPTSSRRSITRSSFSTWFQSHLQNINKAGQNNSRFI